MIRFMVKFKGEGGLPIATVLGIKALETRDLNVGDMQDITRTEQHLERLLGCRIHIQAVDLDPQKV